VSTRTAGAPTGPEAEGPATAYGPEAGRAVAPVPGAPGELVEAIPINIPFPRPEEVEAVAAPAPAAPGEEVGPRPEPLRGDMPLPLPRPEEVEAVAPAPTTPGELVEAIPINIPFPRSEDAAPVGAIVEAARPSIEELPLPLPQAEPQPEVEVRGSETVEAGRQPVEPRPVPAPEPEPPAEIEVRGSETVEAGRQAVETLLAPTLEPELPPDPSGIPRLEEVPEQDP